MKYENKFISGNTTLYQMDCMELMENTPDNYYSLAIVDPPYAVGASDGKFGQTAQNARKSTMKHYANHDKTPSRNYFKELFRVSKNQIIWGSNYYPQHLYHSGAIVWAKKKGRPLSDCEIAFQSYNKLVSRYDQDWSGFVKGGDTSKRIHPNQKPVALYRWLLEKYAVKGQEILDTHLGSGSSAIAAHYFGCEFVGCEIDKDYYKAACRRFQEETRQLRLLKTTTPNKSTTKRRFEHGLF